MAPSSCFSDGNIFSPMAQQPLVCQCLLTIQASPSQSRTHPSLGRSPLDECSARRRDLYLTQYNTHTRQTSMFQAGIEPAIPANDRPQAHALDGAVTGIGTFTFIYENKMAEHPESIKLHSTLVLPRTPSHVNINFLPYFVVRNPLLKFYQVCYIHPVHDNPYQMPDITITEYAGWYIEWCWRNNLIAIHIQARTTP